MKFKRCALLLILLSCLVLSGCGGPEDTYKSAQALLAKGEYAKAGEKFESIGSYEDAATLTMYCKACALCESGDYEAGLKVLATLGGYKDSLYRITYYTARSYEDIAGKDDWERMLEAQNIYETIPVFLDSGERITALDKRIETAKKAQYDAAVKTGENGNYIDACQAFDQLGRYSDSKSRYTYYVIRADEDKLAETTDEAAVSSLAARYRQMGTYLDCEKRAAAMQDKATSILDDKYDTAVSLMKEGRYNDAITAFTAISAHKDSEKQIQMCEIAILDAQYDAALTLKNDGKYEDAISAFSAIESYKDSAEQIKACTTALWDERYSTAVELMNAGKYSDAYDAFTELAGHKDSREKAISIYDEAQGEKFATATVGSSVLWGKYEQDNNKANGNEAIEWLVLAKEKNRLLVISRYALDCKPYNRSDSNMTWEKCTLRSWLNKDFLDAAFSSEEQSRIPAVTVPVAPNPSYSTKPGSITQDKVFLLSYTEAMRYMPPVEVNWFTTTYNASKCQTTAYAEAQGATANVAGWCDWWLRSPGISQNRTSYVAGDMGFDINGANVNSRHYAVRPVMWIDLEP